MSCALFLSTAIFVFAHQTFRLFFAPRAPFFQPREENGADVIAPGLPPCIAGASLSAADDDIEYLTALESQPERAAIETIEGEMVMKKLLFTLGLGAGAMYFFDPELGEIRRSMLADKLSGKLPKTADAFAAKADALTAKVENVAAKADEAVADVVEHVGHKTDEFIAEKVDEA